MKIQFRVGQARITILPKTLIVKRDGVEKVFGWEAMLGSFFKSELAETWVPFGLHEATGVAPPLDTNVWVFDTHYHGVTIGYLKAHPKADEQGDPLYGAQWVVLVTYPLRREGEWSTDCNVSAWASLNSPAPPLSEVRR